MILKKKNKKGTLVPLIGLYVNYINLYIILYINLQLKIMKATN